MNISGDPNLKSYLLDDGQVGQFLALVRAEDSSKILTAPTVILLDGESATARIQNTIKYTAKDEGSDEPVEKERQIGSEFYVMPTLMEDGKSIFLEYKFKHTNLIGFTESGMPETEVANITSRCSFPEGSTFLFGGQKITDDQDGQKVQKVLWCSIKAAKVESDKSPLNN
ncbi:MAG: hypothetical protein KAV87_60035 [Desulfobacteraceae bacterium]|nr:hypothetical protein [Desulfobacteraceae bacterium]